jgi:hypothetical protein
MTRRLATERSLFTTSFKRVSMSVCRKRRRSKFAFSLCSNEQHEDNSLLQ